MLYQTQNPHGGDLYTRPVELDYSANINPFGTPPAVLEAVVQSLSELRNYPDPYCRELVKALSAYEHIPGDCILCGCGAAELIFSFSRAAAPRKALILAPTFSEYESALRSTGCDVERWQLLTGDDLSLTEAFLPFLKDSDADLLVLCNPNNPTGRCIEMGLLEKIAGICHGKKMRLMVDECFLEFTEEYESRSLKRYLQLYPGLFILKAFTKSYGMAGLRLGYCLSADSALLRAMGDCVQPWDVSIPAQRAGAAALTQRAFLEKARTVIRQERQVLTQGLEKLGFTVIPSQANYILFSAFPELRSKLLERGIQIRSCANYHGLDETWYRIAVKLPEENARLLKEMEEVLHG